MDARDFRRRNMNARDLHPNMARLLAVVVTVSLAVALLLYWLGL